MPRERRDVPWMGQRGDTYYAFWYDADARRTQRMSLGTSSAEEAKLAFAQFLMNGHEVYEGSPKGKYPVAACLKDYYSEHVRKKCADPRRQEDAIHHLREFFKGVNVEELEVHHTEAYADARRAGRIGGGRRRKNKVGSDSTIRRELVVLRAACGHALRRKRIDLSDMPAIEMPSVETARQVQWLTREEMAAVFKLTGDHEDPYLHHFIRIAYFTAGRKRAVQGLRMGQVDIENGFINLDVEGRKKTNKRRAIVPLYDDIKPDIAWLARHAEDDRLFGGRDFYRPFRRFMESIGKHDKAHPHVLRHSRATHLLQRGVGIYDVAKLLGDTVATVERTYGHHSPNYLANTTGGL